MSFPLTLAATCVSSRGIFMGTSLSWQEIGVSQPPMEVPMIYKKRTSEVYIHSFVSLMQMPQAPPDAPTLPRSAAHVQALGSPRAALLDGQEEDSERSHSGQGLGL